MFLQSHRKTRRKRDSFVERTENANLSRYSLKSGNEQCQCCCHSARGNCALILAHFCAIPAFSLFWILPFCYLPVLFLHGQTHSLNSSVALCGLKVKHLYLLKEGACFPPETSCFFAECIQYKSKYVPLLINKVLGRLCLEVWLKALIRIQ